jgi:hypothetical protein
MLMHRRTRQVGSSSGRHCLSIFHLQPQDSTQASDQQQPEQERHFMGTAGRSGQLKLADRL